MKKWPPLHWPAWTGQLDAQRDRGDLGLCIYAHGVVRAETLIERATAYARERKR